jgi:broad specificity phosphatase PhoE
MRILVSVLIGALCCLGDPDRTVTIYFMRHAESIWNYNKHKDKGTLKEAEGPNLDKSSKEARDDDSVGSTATTDIDSDDDEFSDVVDNVPESVQGDDSPGPSLQKGLGTASTPVFQVKGAERERDAPLSVRGHNQAIALGEDILARVSTQADDPKAVLRGLVRDGNVVFGVSNLARTQQTMANFLNQCPEDKGFTKPFQIEILNCLQELSHAHDAWSSKGGRTDPEQAVPSALRKRDLFAWRFAPGVSKVIDLNGTLGFLRVGSYFRGRRDYMQRLEDFSVWLNGHYNQGHKTFLVAGHSTWLKALYKKRMGNGATNRYEQTLRKTKLGNASMVKFTFELSARQEKKGAIVPGTTEVVRDVLQTFPSE